MLELLEENKTCTSKIIDFPHFRSIIDASQRNLRVVQSHGVFDLLHIGHIKHFQAAKKQGDILVVTITPDRFVNKGPNRPRFSERLRAEAIAALDCIDFVIINSWPTAVEAIKLIKPHLYAKGDEYQDSASDITGNIDIETATVQALGGHVLFTNEITFSSSELLNQFFSPHSEEVTEYLETFKRKYHTEEIFKYMEKFKKLHVLVVGEAIIDDYQFVEVIGKAGKEPTLVAKHKYTDCYVGGVLALSNHLSDFCNEITCVTYLGEKGEYESIIRSALKHNVKLVPIYKKNSQTIVKRRFIDEYLNQKMFEVYEINDDFLDNQDQKIFIDELKKSLSSHDLTIVADYGHGLLNSESIDLLASKSKFLAVNAQSNAGNNGFNVISNYKKADFVSIATRELQLNYRQRHLSVHEQLSRLMQDYNYKNAMITCGKRGMLVNKRNEKIYEAPALATKIVDRVGAGDAVLAIASLYAYYNAPAEIMGFIGNIVGAHAVGIMGNKQFIEKIPLMKHIAHLLK